MIRYESGQHLLEKTPSFYQYVMRERLNNDFNKVYRYVEALFDGRNPYIEAIANNIQHLVKVISTGNWTLLRRQPPYFVGVKSADKDIDTLVMRQLDIPAASKVAASG
jgi:hypothetical protein